MLTIHLNKSIKAKYINKLIQEITKSPDKQLTVFIDSLGGDVEAAEFFHGFLVSCGKEVVTAVVGQCCSAAMLISVAGVERWAIPTANFLIHEPRDSELPEGIQEYYDAETEVPILAKDYDEIIRIAQETKAELQAQTSKYFKMISEHSNLSVNKIKKAISEAKDGDWFFGAKEALRLGIIDNIGFPGAEPHVAEQP